MTDWTIFSLTGNGSAVDTVYFFLLQESTLQADRLGKKPSLTVIACFRISGIVMASSEVDLIEVVGSYEEKLMSFFALVIFFEIQLVLG